jgi:anti-anti-sigma factor
LCSTAISDGYKVLWLAHTHHLLDQAFHSFDGLLGLVAEPRQSLNMRVVSGTPEHSRAHTIKASDDVLIISLQTARNAAKEQLKAFDDFLESSKGKLFVVFDECHHSPAPSFRNLLLSLRSRFAAMRLLGLTATPIYSDSSKQGWLLKLFPQNLVHQSDPKTLMAAGVLARPIPRQVATEFEPTFTERDFQKWLGTYNDVPEEIITTLAKSQMRNDAIASHYVDHREEYGKTIIFADRWFQCLYIREALRRRGVRADAIFSKVEAGSGSVEERNRRTADENSKVLRQFKADELDVLINVRMLTEGTDVPSVQTVFLTRQTTSNILLTQMIGRALRGPKFGGTKDALIVSFIDNWKHAIPWAQFDGLTAGGTEDDISDPGKQPPLQLISIELVNRLARQMDSGLNVNTSGYRTYLPVGWYEVRFDAAAEGSGDIESVRQLRTVYESEKPGFEHLIHSLCRMELAAFQSEDLRREDIHEQLLAWQAAHFTDIDSRAGGALIEDLFAIARHIAQNEQTAPLYFPFDARDQHDLDAIAQSHFVLDLGDRRKGEILLGEYARQDRLWRIFYPSYGLFKSHYDAAMNRILGVHRHGTTSGLTDPAYTNVENHPDREPTVELKEQVKRRDGYRCLCCGCGNKRQLQVDHIYPAYHGGLNQIENLQTLCDLCNRFKGIDTINFRPNQSALTTAPASLPEVELPSGVDAKEPTQWEFFLRHTFNAFFRCGAVESIEIGQRGSRFKNWEVRLFAGNNPRWLDPFLPDLIGGIRDVRQEAGYQPAPETIQVIDHTSLSVGSRTLPNPTSPRTTAVAITSRPPEASAEVNGPQSSRRHQLDVESIADIAVVNFLEKQILDEENIQVLADELCQVIDKSDSRKLLLSFQNVEFMSSAFLGKLITLHRRIQGIQGKLVLCNIATDIFEVFKLVKLDKLLTIVPDVKSGLKAF